MTVEEFHGHCLMLGFYITQMNSPKTIALFSYLIQDSGTVKSG